MCIRSLIFNFQEIQKLEMQPVRFLVHGKEVLRGVWGRMLLDPETGAAERMFLIFQSRQQIPGLFPELGHIRFMPSS